MKGLGSARRLARIDALDEERSFQSREIATRILQPKHQRVDGEVHGQTDFGTCRYCVIRCLVGDVVVGTKFDKDEEGRRFETEDFRPRAAAGCRLQLEWSMLLPTQVCRRTGRGDNCLVRCTRRDEGAYC